MALVAAQDWPNTMDNRQQRPSHPNSPVNSNDRDVPQQAPYPAQPPYGYPQPWSMPINGVQPHPNGFYPAMQYFPSHYQHPPPHQAPPSPYPQQPYFDPNAQAQFAQWAQAYQQMMYNVHQSQMVQQPQQPPQQSQPPPSQASQQSHSMRSRSGSHSTSSPVPMEYYAQQQPQNFAPQRFPAGTPPPNAQYQGFHPYRRPDRPNERDRPRHRDANSQPSTPPAFQPPYARTDAAGSSSSVNSASGSNSSHRSRTESGNSSERAIAARVNGNNGASTGHNARSKSSSSSSSAPQQPHHQRVSSNASSTTSSIPRSSASSSAASNSSSNAMGSSLSGPAPTVRTQRPSPLSQASTLSTAERRMSRDDSDLDAMLAAQHASSHSGPISGPRSSGLKSRLRRVLSFNAAQTLKEEDEEEGTPNAKSSTKKDKAKETPTTPSTPGEDASSTAGKKPKRSRAASMFNARFNASTDNISLSSTVSSASVMIRKLGSMGRLARRNSLAGITSLFKDKDKDKGKAGKAEASVTLATAEVDRSSYENGASFEGLSPAAALVRQHTLKSNAEAAARAKAQAEAQAAADAKKDADLPITWERNTASRQGGSAAHLNNSGNFTAVREDGVRVVVEDDSDSDDDAIPPVSGGPSQSPGSVGSDSDEDGTWRGHGEEEDDEDVTIRIGLEKNGISNDTHEEDGDSMDEPWALNIRRSVERTRRPTKGILKNASEYAQDSYLESPNPAFAHPRVRANSYDSVPIASNEPGPLARIPSPDPDHIDGLHKHPHGNASSGLLGPLPFESQMTDSPSSTSSPPLPDKSGGLFSQPGLNSSAPALSTMHNTSGSSTLAHRSQTAPSKRLTFAANLNIYDTFSSSVYDRRSEPATWSRLTPALAQRIKEELNSYKMEEMEVHASSRIHTQFFV